MEQSFGYTYLRPSALRGAGAERTIALETSSGSGHPRFFDGFLTAPVPAAAALLTLAEVAAARFDRGPGGSRDPVVTAGGGLLRLESFSGCGGVYARLDVLPSGLDGGEPGRGTTNVDVNPPLRRALALLAGLDPLRLTVGPDALEVATFDGRFVEKRVPLPRRWLRGFAEAQVLAAGLVPRAEVPAAEAAALLGTLPPPTRQAAAATRWVLPAGGGLRPASRPAPGAVCLPGAERLSLLRPVLRRAESVRLYAPADGPEGGPADGPTPVGWELRLPGMRFFLLLSQDARRGFSGEGGVLDDLAAGAAEEDAELLAALPDWERPAGPAELARRTGLPADRVRAALTALGASGRIGYDLAEEAYFRRELPWAAGDPEAFNPRLRAARELVAAGAVRFDGPLARVGAGDRVHLVRPEADAAGRPNGRLGCTCQWWARYRGGRGPCRHVLAVRIIQDSSTKDAR
ncbi:SWIM zinc finger family protein [Phaeacidiphilus oryzae]|uniref:SWIM zinc finger family protein n=1 Tax=Phaeacidiphilus oryzae TaxID=348818 RepID=UPI00055A81F5|nr:SWIM zinc finger family protein [Phaeacidiphilus oryzae]